MSYVVKGFEFNDIETYNIAKKELEYTNSIKEKIDAKNPNTILEVYNKIIIDGVFKTPIGMECLRELQKQLYNNQRIDNNKIQNIKAIIYSENQESPSNIKKNKISNEAPKETIEVKKESTHNKKKSKYRERYIKMLIINAILIITIAIMFIITKSANKFDETYYKESIENKYIGWQNELEQRESSINASESEK